MAVPQGPFFKLGKLKPERQRQEEWRRQFTTTAAAAAVTLSTHSSHLSFTDYHFGGLLRYKQFKLLLML